MAKRILMIVRMKAPANRMGAALAAGRLARESGGAIRMMYVSPLPPPRLDRDDRVVADTDREMARIAGEAEDELRQLTAELGDVPVECVVRFGRLGREVAREAESFGADLVALAAPAPPGRVDRALAWYLERLVLGSITPVVLLPEIAPRGAARPRGALATTVLR